MEKKLYRLMRSSLLKIVFAYIAYIIFSSVIYCMFIIFKVNLTFLSLGIGLIIFGFVSIANKEVYSHYIRFFNNKKYVILREKKWLYEKEIINPFIINVFLLGIIFIYLGVKFLFSTVNINSIFSELLYFILFMIYVYFSDLLLNYFTKNSCTIREYMFIDSIFQCIESIIIFIILFCVIYY